MQQSIPFIVAVLSFAAVAALAFVLGQYLTLQSRLNRRLSLPAQASDVTKDRPPGGLGGFITRHFDEKRFGVDDTLRGKLRRELLKAGYFRGDALNYYIFIRLAAVIVFPTLSYLVIEIFMDELDWPLKMLIVSVAALIAIIGPDAFLARRHRVLIEQHRRAFPDLLDLLVVCVDSGLSLEAALDRVTGEIVKQDKVLGLNLLMMGAEMRAGRSTIEALNLLAERLGLDEARSLVLMLRQSIELGTDVGEALRVFSDEMRDKRIIRAEENANKLPVKMVGPMAMLIFPVILMEIMLPIGLRVMEVLN